MHMLVKSCNAVLIYSSPAKEQLCHALSDSQTIVIGRDPACQIALAPTLYKGVSRRHAELCPVVSAGKSTQWQIQDLNSVNGVFINGHPLQKAEILQNGDRITLGSNGIEFLFELQFDPVAPSISDSALIPDTIYEHHSESTLHTSCISVAAIPQPGFNIAKILAGVVGVAVIFLLNSAPVPQQTQRPPSPPASEPSSSPSAQPPLSEQPPQQRSSTGLADVEFQGMDLFTQYFDIIEDEIVEDVPYTTTSGQESTFDAYRFKVVAKSAFQDSDVDFTIHFYDVAGNVTSPSTQIYYASSPQRWALGMKRVAVFLLPSDRSNLKVIRFSH